MIGEAIDTAITLGVALLAWIVVAAAVGTVVLLGAAAAAAWAVKTLRRGVRARRHPEDSCTPAGATNTPSGDSADTGTPPRPAQGRSRPSWSHSQPPDYDEAA